MTVVLFFCSCYTCELSSFVLIINRINSLSQCKYEYYLYVSDQSQPFFEIVPFCSQILSNKLINFIIVYNMISFNYLHLKRCFKPVYVYT